jgi:putative effector of murein hydrolase
VSDQETGETRSSAVASATQAMAIKQVNDEIGGIRKQLKTLWIVVGVIGTITLILAILTLLPRFGVRLGGGAFPGRSGFTNGQQLNGPGGTGGTGTQPTAP